MLVTAPHGGIVNDPVLVHPEENVWWMQLADSDAGLYALGALSQLDLDAEVSYPDVHPCQVQGPLSGRTLAKLVGERIFDLKYYWCDNFEIDGVPVVITRTGWSAVPGFEVNLLDGSCGDQVWDAIMAAGEEFAIRPIAPNEARRVEAGIMVTYEEIIENNAQFAGQMAKTLASGRATGYDLVVLTNSWQLTQLVDKGYLVPLDHSQLGNFARYASPLVKSPAYDPGNKYTVAWQSGFTGIAYDSRRIDRNSITSVHDLWNPAYAGRVGMMTDLNDFGSAGLLYIGADVTNSTEDDWHRAGEALQRQKDAGIVHHYYDQRYIDALERGDIWITQAWSGDVFQARASGYPHLEFVVPEEGVMHWTDNMGEPITDAE